VKKRLALILTGVVVLTIITLIVTIPATAANASVTIDTPPELEPASVFNATISISDITDLNAVQYDITFDPAVLQLNEIASGEIGASVMPVPTGPAAPREVQPGHWKVVQSMGLGTISGAGYLAVLSFTVIGFPGDESDIDIDDGMISTMEGEITATWTGGRVRIAAPESSGDDAPAPPTLPPQTSVPSAPPVTSSHQSVPTSPTANSQDSNTGRVAELPDAAIPSNQTSNTDIATIHSLAETTTHAVQAPAKAEVDTPQPSTPLPIPPSPKIKSINWPMWGTIAGVVLFMVFFTLFQFRKRI
jgi:hypothetical protein